MGPERATRSPSFASAASQRAGGDLEGADEPASTQLSTRRATSLRKALAAAASRSEHKVVSNAARELRRALEVAASLADLGDAGCSLSKSELRPAAETAGVARLRSSMACGPSGAEVPRVPVLGQSRGMPPRLAATRSCRVASSPGSSWRFKQRPASEVQSSGMVLVFDEVDAGCRGAAPPSG